MEYRRRFSIPLRPVNSGGSRAHAQGACLSLSGGGQGLYSLGPAEIQQEISPPTSPACQHPQRRTLLPSQSSLSPPRERFEQLFLGSTFYLLSLSCSSPWGLGCLLIGHSVKCRQLRVRDWHPGLSHVLCDHFAVRGKDSLGALMLYFPLVPVICYPSGWVLCHPAVGMG